MPRILLVSICAAVWLAGSPARAQTGANVLVVANDAVAGSVDIAERYVAVRKVPADQVVRLKTAATADVSRKAFESEIAGPIVAWISAHNSQDRILYLVLTRGVPLRIVGTAGRDGTSASVDSELALLYRRMTGAFIPVNGAIPNPYFAAGGAEAGKPFSHAEQDIYLVTRLDGFTVNDAMGLIDRAASPSRDGRVLLDEPASGDVRSTWYDATAKRLESAGFGGRVVHDTSARVLKGETGVLGYSSWGSNDPGLESRDMGLSFVPGALATMFLSTDARTFAQPPAGWNPGRTHPMEYAGSSQSLIGDLVHAGATGVSGQVGEPYLDGSIRPDVLFPAYVSGFNLAESYYLAMPYLSWQSVIVGDPLCAPFRKPTLTVIDNAAIDPDTELPVLFSARRLAADADRFHNQAYLKLLVRSETRLAHGDQQGAADAQRQAVALDPNGIAAWRALGATLESLHDYTGAKAAYEHVVKLDDKEVVALNNLAFIIAVREQRPADALPLATRALALQNNSAVVQDTVGWIRHLLGENEEAARLLAWASRGEPNNADIQFHAAVALQLVGRRDEATRALNAAGALDPAMKERADFRELQRKLAGDAQSKE